MKDFDNITAVAVGGTGGGGTERLRLTEPAAEYDREIRAYRAAFLESGDSMDGTNGLEDFDDPRDWIAFLERHRDPLTVPPGRVPSTQYMLVREEGRKIVGMIDVRHFLNDFLEKYGGHVGYSVAPDERRKGYAARMLGMALPKCAALGIDRVLITCVSGNEGSRKTILKNGGVYESAVYEPDEGVRLERYWIDLSRQPEKRTGQKGMGNAD